MKYSERGSLRMLRLIASAIVFLLLFSGLHSLLLPENLPLSLRSALAEDPDEWEDSPDDPEFDPYYYDLDTIPFLLMKVEGKEPGIRKLQKAVVYLDSVRRTVHRG